ncbi:hypothetical protein CAY59_00710 [Vibrio campbellii]|nr:hypothetical protein CAY59_00710 [Vibrio campbellii]
MRIGIKTVIIQVFAQIGSLFFANAVNYGEPFKLALLILFIISCYNINTIFEAKNTVNIIEKTVFCLSLLSSCFVGFLIFFIHAVSVVGWR